LFLFLFLLIDLLFDPKFDLLTALAVALAVARVVKHSRKHLQISNIPGQFGRRTRLPQIVLGAYTLPTIDASRSDVILASDETKNGTTTCSPRRHSVAFP